MKEKISTNDLRFLRRNYDGYFRPVIPPKLLREIGWEKDGELYQWDYENGKITLSRNPKKPPTIVEEAENE